MNDFLNGLLAWVNCSVDWSRAIEGILILRHAAMYFQSEIS